MTKMAKIVKNRIVFFNNLQFIGLNKIFSECKYFTLDRLLVVLI